MISARKEWGKFTTGNMTGGEIKSSIVKQLKYSLKIYTSGIIGFFYEPFTKILISNFLGVNEVGFYDIALRLKNQLWGFISKIFYPLFPFFAEQADPLTIKNYVHDLEQKTFFVVIPIIVITIFIMEPFIQIWIGENVSIIALTSIFIISFHFIGSDTVIPNYQYLMAKEHAEKTTIIQTSNVVFNTLFFLISVHFIGYYAIVVGNVAAILSSFVVCLYYQKKYLNSMIFDSFVQLLKLSASFLILITIGYLVKMSFRWNDLLLIFAVPLVIAVTTVVLYKYFGLVTHNDIERYFGTNNKYTRALAQFYN